MRKHIITIIIVIVVFNNVFTKDLHEIESGINSYSMFSFFVGYSYYFNTYNLKLVTKIELPILLWITTSSIDTFSVSGGVEYWHDLNKSFKIGTSLLTELRLHQQLLGSFESIGCLARIYAGLEAGSFQAGLYNEFQTAIITFVHLSDYVKETFKERYINEESPLNTVVVWFSSLNYTIGIYGNFRITKKLQIKSECGIKLTPSDFVGFGEGMMFGLLPFQLKLTFATLL